MAAPISFWDAFKSDSFHAVMRVILYMPDGEGGVTPVVYSSDEGDTYEEIGDTTEEIDEPDSYNPTGEEDETKASIASVQFELNAFDSDEILFGTPQASTGTITFADYAQTMNPVIHPEYVSGLDLDLQLGVYVGEGWDNVGEVDEDGDEPDEPSGSDLLSQRSEQVIDHMWTEEDIKNKVGEETRWFNYTAIDNPAHTDEEVYAWPFTIKDHFLNSEGTEEPLTTLRRYRQRDNDTTAGVLYELVFDYTYQDDDGEHTGKVDVIGTLDELFFYSQTYQTNYPSMDYAIWFPYECEIENVQLYEIDEIYWQPYGKWVTEEWSYSSDGSEASVDIVDKMNEVLTNDMRVSAYSDAGIIPQAAEGSNRLNLLDFAREFLSLSDGDLDISTVEYLEEYDVLYTFFEESQSKTVGDLAIALGSCLTCMPDGTLTMYDHKGYYTMDDVVLYDDDLYSYDVEQTSGVTTDSVEVEAMIPTREVASSVASYTDLSLGDNDIVPLTCDRVISVDSISGKTDNTFTSVPAYTYDPVNLYYNPTDVWDHLPSIPLVNYIEFNAYGTFVNFSDSTVTVTGATVGTLPYDAIKDNSYIQTLEHAQALADIIDPYTTRPYNCLTIDFRGGFGFWLGGRLHVRSERFGIDAFYVITSLNFSFDGFISTTLTMQWVEDV